MGSQPDEVGHRVAQIAARQYGVVARRQLTSLGVTGRRVDGLVARGWLHPVQRGVYVTSRTPLSPRGRATAVLLGQPGGTVLSHRTAAGLWGLTAWPRHVEITIRTSGGARSRGGVVVHRARLPEEEVAVRDRLPVTTPARTLLDVAAVAPGRLEGAIAQADHMGLLDLNAVHAVLSRHPRRRGSRVLRALLQRDWLDLTLTRSALEAMVLELCRGHGIEMPAVNAVVRGLTVDFLWPGSRLIVEADGARTHLTHAAFEEDRLRDATLTAAGYRVVRFSHRRVTRDPGAVAATLRELTAASDPRRS
jgi:hypothetical protein